MTSSVPGPVRAYVAWVLARGRLIWAVALLLAVPAVARTAYLYIHLRSELEQLLPRESPSVRAIDELRARMPGLQYLGVIVDTGTAENVPAGEKLLDDLAAKVRAYPPDLVRGVRLGDAQERKFLEDNAPLYMDLADLKTIRERIEARRDWEVNKEEGSDLAQDETPPSLDFSDIEQHYKERTGGGNPSENGRFSSRSKHLTLMLIEVGGFETARGKAEQLFDRVKADVAGLGGPEHYAPGMRVGYTGDIAIGVEETSALMADLSFSSVVVLVLVVAVLIGYYRWWKSIVALVPPLLLAAMYSFGLASLPPFSVDELNSNTAFLGSIIVGNGINFGIILLARYVEERRAGVGRDEAMAIAVWGSRAGTLSAALAAGVSYASLALTDFRGFRQFGTIGGIGMVLSWVCAYVLVPSLAKWLDTDETLPGKAAQGRLMAPVARAIVRWPGAIALVAAAITVLAITRVHSFGASSLEYDFSKLRRADTWTKGEGYWGNRMDDLLGAYLTPTVILTDDVAQARAIAAALREQAKTPPMSEMISSIRTIDDVLPQDQPAKIAETDAIKEDMTPHMRTLVPPDKKELVGRIIDAPELKPLVPSDLPTTFTTGLREKNGEFGRAVLVYPRPSHALWEGPPLAAFVASLRATAGKGRVAGSLPLSADILDSIRRDGLKASLAALGGVMLVVLLIFRRNTTTLVVIGSLLVGVLWLFAATMALGVRINFANFIAFPITFGIGVDYAVNVMSRYVQDTPRDVVATIRTTGGAVTLCSLTTIIGYSSLLMAENRALYLFGLVAVLGEICCLSAGVVAMPAAVEWWRRRSARGGPEVGSAS